MHNIDLFERTSQTIANLVYLGPIERCWRRSVSAQKWRLNAGFGQLVGNLKVCNGEKRRPAPQRLLPVVSARFLAAQLHDLAYHSAAIHFDQKNAKGNDSFFMLPLE